jgi:hypothetical protein
MRATPAVIRQYIATQPGDEFGDWTIYRLDQAGTRRVTLLMMLGHESRPDDSEIRYQHVIVI